MAVIQMVLSLFFPLGKQNPVWSVRLPRANIQVGEASIFSSSCFLTLVALKVSNYFFLNKNGLKGIDLPYSFQAIYEQISFGGLRI